jgi:uncharacterized OB-fold protein
VKERPLPVIDGPDAPFWQALRHREVRMQRCEACGAFRFPAARICPNCRAEGSHWTAVEPTGVIETWCVFHKAYFKGLEVPYTVIQVRLDCAARLFSNPVDIAADSLRIGMRVEAVFEDVTPEVTLLKFRPAKSVASARE